MMLKSDTLVRVAVFLAVSVLAGCRASPGGVPVAGPESAALLLNRNWIDRMPETKDDKLHVFRFVPNMGGGVYQDRTIFFGTFELFQFEHTDRQVRFDLLHTGDRQTVDYRIERIEPKKRGDFDLRLTFSSSPRGPSVYYGWSRETAERLDADLAALVP